MNISTYWVDKIHNFSPDDAFANVYLKINKIRAGIAAMKSSASGLYDSIRDPDPCFQPSSINVISVDPIMQGVNELKVHQTGKAVYTFSLFSREDMLYDHPALLEISEIKEYVICHESFSSRSKIVQLIISALLVLNYVCRCFGIYFFVPALLFSVIPVKIKHCKEAVCGSGLMLFYGFVIGPILRQWIENMSQPATSNVHTDSLLAELRKADEAIEMIENCEADLMRIIREDTQEFSEGYLGLLLRIRHFSLHLLDVFLKNTSSHIANQQDILWEIKALLKEPNLLF